MRSYDKLVSASIHPPMQQALLQDSEDSIGGLSAMRISCVFTADRVVLYSVTISITSLSPVLSRTELYERVSRASRTLARPLARVWSDCNRCFVRELVSLTATRV